MALGLPLCRLVLVCFFCFLFSTVLCPFMTSETDMPLILKAHFQASVSQLDPDALTLFKASLWFLQTVDCAASLPAGRETLFVTFPCIAELECHFRSLTNRKGRPRTRRSLRSASESCERLKKKAKPKKQNKTSPQVERLTRKKPPQ